MSRRRPKWKRPTPKPAIVVSMPQPRIIEVVNDTEMMKKVAQDVVLVMNGLEAQNNTGAF